MRALPEKTGALQYHSPATLSKSGGDLVQNTWYELLATSEHVTLFSLVVTQANDESAAKDIEVRITIDEQTVTGSVSQDHNGNYRWYFSDLSEALTASTTPYLMRLYEPAHGLSVKVEVRLTSAKGTNQTLTAALVYEDVHNCCCEVEG